MKGWILSVVGIVFIGVVLDIILPDGKTSKFIKHIFSIFLLFIIINPITKLSINKNWFSLGSVTVDSDFIYKVNIKKIEALSQTIITELNNIKIYNSHVIINSNVFSEDLEISSVYVDLIASNVELSDEVKNKVISIVKKVINVSDSEVKVYGR